MSGHLLSHEGDLLNWKSFVYHRSVLYSKRRYFSVTITECVERYHHSVALALYHVLRHYAGTCSECNEQNHYIVNNKVPESVLIGRSILYGNYPCHVYSLACSVSHQEFWLRLSESSYQFYQYKISKLWGCIRSNRTLTWKHTTCCTMILLEKQGAI